MTDWAAIIGSIATLLTVLGGALRFLWNKVERKIDDAEEKGRERFDEIDKQLEECRAREAVTTRINATQLTVIELIWNDLKKLQPKSGTLARAHKLLEHLKKQTNEGLLP